MKPAAPAPRTVAPAFVPPTTNGYYGPDTLGYTNVGSGSRVAPSFGICGFDGPVYRVQSDVWLANIAHSSGH
jgi:hypothetical protein